MKNKATLNWAIPFKKEEEFKVNREEQETYEQWVAKGNRPEIIPPGVTRDNKESGAKAGILGDVTCRITAQVYGFHLHF